MREVGATGLARIRSGFGPAGRAATTVAVGLAAGGTAPPVAGLKLGRGAGLAATFGRDATAATGCGGAIERGATGAFFVVAARLAAGFAERAGGRLPAAARGRAAARFGATRLRAGLAAAFFTRAVEAGRRFATRAAGFFFVLAAAFDFGAGFFFAFAGLRVAGFFFTALFATPSPPG